MDEQQKIEELKVANAANDQKLEELKARAREKFTEKEIDDFINLGTSLANKVIYNVLAATVLEGPSLGLGTTSAANKIVKKINKAAPKQPAAYLKIDLAELDECPYVSLNVCLAPKPREYETTIGIPKQYVNDLYAKYNTLKQVAVASWRQICQDQPLILKLVREYRHDVDFSELVIDEKQPTSMYFDPACKTRVSIFAYYVGKDNELYYKK